ncbi:MAG: division/cell wall cluster transcriptional repressor MraZ [Elusimicrobiota bacterium]
MFIGEFEHTIDNKARVSIPTKLRISLEQSRKGLILTRGFDNCLYLYTKKNWDIISDRLKNITDHKTNAGDYRAFLRVFFSGAINVDIDSHGRILISEIHRKYADIKKNVVIIGMVDRVEIWSKERWSAYRMKAEKSFAKSSEKIFEI